MIRIIDNKKLDLTEEEFASYEKICRSYDRPSFKGEELFKGLFLTDGAGTITFINPPNQRYTSMEVFLFIVAIYNHQHIRLMHKQVEDLCADLRAQIKTIK